VTPREQAIRQALIRLGHQAEWYGAPAERWLDVYCTSKGCRLRIIVVGERWSVQCVGRLKLETLERWLSEVREAVTHGEE